MSSQSCTDKSYLASRDLSLRPHTTAVGLARFAKIFGAFGVKAADSTIGAAPA